MTELPKIARERLARAPAAGEHLDADLLAALAEQRLHGAERERALAHLAACADCREVAAVGAPREEPTQTVVRPVRRRFWLFQPAVMRWGSLAALVVVAAAASVYLREGNRPGPAQQGMVAQRQESAAAPAKTETAGKPEEVANLAIPERKTRETAGARKDLRPAAPNPSKRDMEMDARLQPSASSSAVEPAGATPAPAVGTGAAGGIAAGAPVVGGNVEQQKTAKVSPPPAPAEMAENLPASAADDKLKQEPPARARNYNTLAAAPLAQAQTVEVLAKKALPPSLWTVGSDGRVQRSTDGGKSWSKAKIDKHAQFLAVSATGADVWAGGKAGALYHSSDGGGHWTRVAAPTSNDIVRLDFTDALQGTLATAAGEQWRTMDGGKSWEAKK